jgi:hypothetical protein
MRAAYKPACLQLRKNPGGGDGVENLALLRECLLASAFKLPQDLRDEIPGSFMMAELRINRSLRRLKLRQRTRFDQ